MSTIAGKLKAVKAFQASGNGSVLLGGSLALFLYGVKLNREITVGDIDVAVDSFDPTTFKQSAVKKSDGCDFQYSVMCCGYTFDVKIEKSTRWTNVIHEGINYRLQPLDVILKYKCEYAAKGNRKHAADVHFIATGKILEEPAYSDLPF